MNVATPTQTQPTPTTQAAPNTATETDSTAPSSAADGSIEALLEAASVDGQASEAPEAEAPAPEQTPEAAAAKDKLTLANETLKKARQIAKSRREADARAERERLRAENFSRQLEQERQETARAREEREALKKDPLAAIRKLGVSSRDLAQRAIDEGTPEAALAALKAELGEERAARLALKTEIDQRNQASALQESERTFFALIKPDTHPRLSTFDQDLILPMARSAFAKAQANGHNPSDSQVLNYLERVLSAPQDASAGTPTPKTNPGTTVAKPVAKPSPTSRTVTAELAGRRYTAPSNIDDLDLHSQKDALAKMIEDAYRDS